MALTKDQIKTTYPLPVYNYKVEIDGNTVGFSEVTGVSVATLFAWINSIQLNRIDKKDIYVRLCDETGAAVVSWKVINAFPTKLDAPSFTASSHDAAVESMELMADGVVVEQA